MGQLGQLLYLRDPVAAILAYRASRLLALQYYRVMTAALLHGGLMHIMFNMMSFLSIGSGLVGGR